MGIPSSYQHHINAQVFLLKALSVVALSTEL